MSGNETGKVMICFLPSSSDLLQKSWLNTMAAKLAPKNDENREPMVHVELFFPTRTSQDSILGHSCGIHYGGKVFYAPKQFSKKNWMFRTLPVTRQQHAKLLRFSKAQENGGFNYSGYYAPCSLMPRKNRISEPLIEEQSWYCSELVASALEYANLLQPGSDAHTHPDALYEQVKDSTYADCARSLDTAILKL